ncbi:MAG TPA: alpha/beta fold hydrolase, partial [Actinomycetota bacterium]
VVALARATASEVWTDALPELMEMDLRHAVPRIGVPALVVVGELDRVTPPAAAIQLTGALPDGRLAVISSAGHIPMLDHADRFLAELRPFVAEVLRGEPRKRTRRRKPREGAA